MSKVRSSASKKSTQTFRYKQRPVTVSRGGDRNSIGLTLRANGRIGVSAPKGTRVAAIRSILRDNAGWIDQHLSRFQNLRKEHPLPEFREGDQFYFLGRELRLVFAPGRERITFTVREGQLVAHIPESHENDRHDVRAALIDFYKQIGSHYMRARLEKLRRKMGVRPRSVRFLSQNSRWGSCSAKGRINLNWRLIFAPPEVIDYIIVHELAHLRFYNHSKQFWDFVGSHVRAVEDRKRWLADHQFDADFLGTTSELHPSPN